VTKITLRTFPQPDVWVCIPLHKTQGNELIDIQGGTLFYNASYVRDIIYRPQPEYRLRRNCGYSGTTSQRLSPGGPIPIPIPKPTFLPAIMSSPESG